MNNSKVWKCIVAIASALTIMGITTAVLAEVRDWSERLAAQGMGPWEILSRGIWVGMGILCMVSSMLILTIHVLMPLVPTSTSQYKPGKYEDAVPVHVDDDNAPMMHVTERELRLESEAMFEAHKEAMAFFSELDNPSRTKPN